MQDIIALEELGGESVDCPDCFDAMIKFYDWDKIRYVCENCDLTSRGGEDGVWKRE